MRERTKKSRQKNRTNLSPVYELIFELSKLFDSECEVCLKKMKKPMSGFTIHHLIYRKNEKTHKNFLDRLKYYEYLKPIILRSHKECRLHEDFAFICNACHHSIDGPRGLKRRKRMNVLRLFLLYIRTNT